MMVVGWWHLGAKKGISCLWSPMYPPKDKPCLLPWVRVSVIVAKSDLHGTCFGELPFIPLAFLLLKGLCRIISPTNPLLVFIPPPSRPKGSDISFNCSISLWLSEIHRCVSNICNVKRGILDVITSYNNSLYQFFFLFFNYKFSYK